eukprot:3147248-Lingulodinium_polyedra.AAC.1
MALIRNETTSAWAVARKLKERFEFAVLMKRSTTGSARQGAEPDTTSDATVTANEMIENYYQHTEPLKDRLYFQDLK